MSDYQTCNFCEFATKTSAQLFNHIVKAHKHEPKAKPTCMYCPFKSYSRNSLVSHVRKKHSQHLGVNGNQEQFVEGDIEEPILGENATQQDWLSYYEMRIAKYLLKFES